MLSEIGRVAASDRQLTSLVMENDRAHVDMVAFRASTNGSAHRSIGRQYRRRLLHCRTRAQSTSARSERSSRQG